MCRIMRTLYFIYNKYMLICTTPPAVTRWRCFLILRIMQVMLIPDNFCKLFKITYSPHQRATWQEIGNDFLPFYSEVERRRRLAKFFCQYILVMKIESFMQNPRRVLPQAIPQSSSYFRKECGQSSLKACHPGIE